MKSKVYTIEYEINNELKKFECSKFSLHRMVEKFESEGATNIKTIQHEFIKKTNRKKR